MKYIARILTIGTATVAVLSSTIAQAAMIRDSLTGPDSGDTTMVQSALTSTAADQRASDTAPSISGDTSDWYGNDRLGAGYNVHGSVGTSGSGSSGGYASAYNNLTVTARALGDTKTPIQSYFYATTDWFGLKSNVYAYIYAMGNLVRNGSRGGAQFNNYALTSLSQDFWTSPEGSFNVGSVPVVAKLKIYGTAKQTANGRIWVQGIDATLTQTAAVKGEATAGLQVPSGVFSGGVSLKDVSLTTLSLPLVATAKWWGISAAPGSCPQMSDVGVKYSVDLQWLSGRLVLWAKAFWVLSGEYEIASWPGITKSVTFLNYPKQTKQFGTTCFPSPGTPPTL